MNELAIAVALYLLAVLADLVDRRSASRGHGSERTGNHRPLVASSHTRRMR